ncbi:MAG TPA: biotin carboxylase N-terminal domain-containing protein [Myxococcota bacterium]|nr:biotin carboxylase N-terminal domain-containing protein [Myxococcota bacterium]HQK50874.1 biotin carboxylase N-terminal domain-containing protein [Myxococcota bacterium]
MIRTTVLVANRGEAAVRIIRACRRLGLSPATVFAGRDRHSPHVRMADQAVALQGQAVRETYLDVEQVVAAARAVGARLVHPGYGFLAENAALREACDREGLVLVGPTADQMRRLGAKLPARLLARRLGIPVVEGSQGETATVQEALRAASDVGFPVLLKASAGGGGRGMRRVDRPEDLPAAFEAAQREAMAAFGCPSLFLERYVESSRHVEVQVVGDGRGRVLSLGERFCSVQRRHQKMIEEAPAPNLDPGLRVTMEAWARRLAESQQYLGAGTVEFLVGPDGRACFLEMNTRLQVEHPVTEAIFGVDLVAAQLQIALGGDLPWEPGDLAPRGHAIECRVCAEDPYRGFVGSPGTLFRYRPPRGPFLRVDDGVEEGSEMLPDYDSLIAKVITWDRNREEALLRMEQALEEFEIGGVRHNLPSLLHVLRSVPFRDGDYGTDLLTRIGPLPATEFFHSEEVAAAAAARALLERAPDSRKAPGDSEVSKGPSPWRQATWPSWSRGGFR